MPNDPLWINANAGAPAYTANELRQAMALVLAYGGRLLGARQGVRPGGDQLKTSIAVSTITVKAGVCVLDPGLSTPQGPYWVAVGADETHTLTAADPTNPRKDITIVRVYDHDEDSSGQRKAQTEYLVGTPAASPTEPAVPAGAMRLATIDVPASGGGSAVVTDRRVYTTAAGGIIPVADGTELAAIAGPYDGLVAARRDTDTLHLYIGSGWKRVAIDTETYTVAEALTSANDTTTSTSYANGTTNGVAFVAPPSGGVMITIEGWIGTGSTDATNGTYMSDIVRTGSTVGAGSTVRASDDTRAAFWKPAVSAAGFKYAPACYRSLLSGLTPGASYNAASQFRTTVGTVTAAVHHRRVLVEPIP